MNHRLKDHRAFEKVQRKLVYLAWRKYRIGATDAEDIFQNAVATYYEIKDRFDKSDNETAILVGIFYKKCLEHLDARKRESRRIKSITKNLQESGSSAWFTPENVKENRSILGELIRREDGRRILSAMASLKPESQEMFRLMVEEELGRQEMIRHFGVNKNTYDTRLRAARLELKDALQKKGVLS
jgi:RNA polymerase sigma factor (sigma-70 family)